MLLVGCASSAPDLLVDLRTDLRAGYDFDEVRTRVLEAPSVATLGWERIIPAARGESFLDGRRVAERVDVERGDYVIEVSLLDAGVDLYTRRVRVRVETTQSVTAVITSDCAGIVCPSVGDPAGATECVGRRCVVPACTPDHPEACPVARCASDGDCTSAGGCLSPRCVAGDCFEQPDDTVCGVGNYCDLGGTCLPSPVLPDAGPRDGGVADVGSGLHDAGTTTCVPSDCDDGDSCTSDTCGAGGCGHTPLCGGGDYCVTGSCYPEPSLSITANDGTSCVDLGVPHASGSNYAYRRVTGGRAGRGATQTNEHVSCGDPVMDADVYSLDASGADTFTFYSGAVSDCWSSIYGRWSVRTRIDGHTSAPVEVTYYNSTCPNVRTCTAGRSFCSPCDCSAAEYCYAGSGCAPVPTLTIDTASGPGCVDLGVAHLSPPALDVIITGRPSSSSTQYNEHASCTGSSPVASDVRALGATGRVSDPLTTGAVTDCTSITYGRWNVYVSVDGEVSNTVEVVYYNSTCPLASGIRTCASASSACMP